MSDWFSDNGLTTPGAPPAGASPPPAGPAGPAGPAQPAAPAQVATNWFSQNGLTQQQPAPAAQPAHPAVQAGIVSPAATLPPVNTTGPGSVTANPRGEGIYRMVGPDAKEVGIPFSLAGKLGKRDGYRFADDAEMHRFVKDYASDPRVLQDMQRMAGDDPGMQLLMGFARGALQTVFGIGDVASGGQSFDPKEMNIKPQGSNKSALRQFSEEPDNSFGERLGGLGENVAEFAGAEKFLKLLPELTGAKKLQTATRLAQMAEKHPLIAEALTQGTVAGGQTYAKTGGDATSAAEAALLTAGMAGTIGGLAGKQSKALSSRMPGETNIAGQAFDTPAPRDIPQATKNQASGQEVIKATAKKTAASHIEELNESRREPAPAGPMLPARTGPFEFNLKGPTPEETTTGKMHVRAADIPPTHTSMPADRAGKTNYARVGTEPEYIKPGDTFAERTGRVHVERRIPGAMHSSAPGETPSDTTIGGGGTLTTQDPNVAIGHVKNLDEIINGPEFKNLTPDHQADILDARADAAHQLADYHEQVRTQLPGYGKPQMPEIEPAKAIEKVGSHTDAANLVLGQAREGYQHITDSLALAGESPQKLNQVKLAYQAAESHYMTADTEESLHAAEGEIEATHEALAEMVHNRIPNSINLKEFSGLNDAYRNGLGLTKIARAVDGSFTGTTSSAKRAFEYSGFDGLKLQKNLDKLVQTMGRGPIERLIGRDNLDALLQVAQANTTNESRAKWGMATREIKENLIRMHVGPIAAGGYLGRMLKLPWEVGAATGWATAEGMRRLNGLIIARPQLARNIVYALNYGAKPQNYGPFLATMIRQMVEESNKEEAPDADQTR